MTEGGGKEGGVCPFFALSQCEECQGGKPGDVGGGDEKVGGDLGCGWLGGDMAG